MITDLYPAPSPQPCQCDKCRNAAGPGLGFLSTTRSVQTPFGDLDWKTIILAALAAYVLYRIYQDSQQRKRYEAVKTRLDEAERPRRRSRSRRD